MPRIAGVTVSLEIEGVRLEEFGVEHDERANVVTCWVPCQAEKEFRFAVSLDEPAPRALYYSVGLRVDGKSMLTRRVPNSIICKDKKCSASRPVYLEGQRDGDCIRPFRFAPVQQTSDDLFLGNVVKIGELVASIHTFTGSKPNDTPYHRLAPMDVGDGVVHETGSKGLTTCVQWVFVWCYQPFIHVAQIWGAATFISGSTFNTAPSSRFHAQFRRIQESRQNNIQVSSKGWVSDDSLEIVWHSPDSTRAPTDVLVANGIAPRPLSAAAPGAASTTNCSQAIMPSSTKAGPSSVKEEDNSRLPRFATQPLTPQPQAGPSSLKEELVDQNTSAAEDDGDAELKALQARAAALQELSAIQGRIAQLAASKKRARRGEGSADARKRVKKEPTASSLILGENFAALRHQLGYAGPASLHPPIAQSWVVSVIAFFIRIPGDDSLPPVETRKRPQWDLGRVMMLLLVLVRTLDGLVSVEGYLDGPERVSNPIISAL
ncbi:hypothetical protein NMY22_g2306 [Coprinellus aureogranulatus]|nr:hypothetical protein NMY22_g2306 [Coprinellus aureogranulatus]